MHVPVQVTDLFRQIGVIFSLKFFSDAPYYEM